MAQTGGSARGGVCVVGCRSQRDLQDIRAKLEREKTVTSDLAEKLAEEERRHADAQQVAE